MKKIKKYYCFKCGTQCDVKEFRRSEGVYDTSTGDLIFKTGIYVRCPRKYSGVLGVIQFFANGELDPEHTDKEISDEYI